MEVIINSKAFGQKIVYFDDEDYDLIKEYTWTIIKSRKTFYAKGSKGKKRGGDGRIIGMHRLVMQCNPEDIIDHADRNGLNNLKSNLRISTQAQNAWNRTGFSSSGYKGVHYNKRYKRYLVVLTISGEVKYGGYFDYPLVAADKYNELAIKYHGEFACLNEFTDDEKILIKYQKANPLPKRKRIGSCKGKFGKNHGKSKGVIKYNINGDYIATYDSLTQAAKENNINLPHLSIKLSKGIDVICGYKWKLI